MAGMQGMSMVHDFFGNVSTSATSTAASLTAAGRTTSARRRPTRRPYWVPALYQNGRRIVPRLMSIYYRTAGRRASSIKTLPRVSR